MLYSHHFCLIPRHLHHPKRNPYIQNLLFPIPTSYLLLIPRKAPVCILSVWIYLILDISYTWNDRICDLCFWLLLLNIMLLMCTSTSWPVLILNFFSWLSKIQLCIYTPKFIYLCIDGHLGWFHLLIIVDSAVINIRVHVFQYLFSVLGPIYLSRIAWSFVNSMLNCFKNYQTVFHSFCTFHFPTGHA